MFIIYFKMEYYLDQLPEIIISKINDYTPRDKDMKAPTSAHIKSLLYYYNYDYSELYGELYGLSDEFNEWDEQHGLDDVNPLEGFDLELFYKPEDNEPFYKYTLRIYEKEKGLDEQLKQLYTRYVY